MCWNIYFMLKGCSPFCTLQNFRTFFLIQFQQVCFVLLSLFSFHACPKFKGKTEHTKFVLRKLNSNFHLKKIGILIKSQKNKNKNNNLKYRQSANTHRITPQLENNKIYSS
jgi:hypothetical protein